jgi:hypothetical protein
LFDRVYRENWGLAEIVYIVAVAIVWGVDNVHCVYEQGSYRACDYVGHCWGHWLPFPCSEQGHGTQVTPQSVYMQHFFHQRVEVCSWSSVALCLCQKCIVIFGVIFFYAFGSVVFAFHWFRICSLVRVYVRRVSKSLANILKPSGFFMYHQV